MFATGSREHETQAAGDERGSERGLDGRGALTARALASPRPPTATRCAETGAERRGGTLRVVGSARARRALHRSASRSSARRPSLKRRTCSAIGGGRSVIPRVPPPRAPAAAGGARRGPRRPGTSVARACRSEARHVGDRRLRSEAQASASSRRSRRAARRTTMTVSSMTRARNLSAAAPKRRRPHRRARQRRPSGSAAPRQPRRRHGHRLPGRRHGRGAAEAAWARAITRARTAAATRDVALVIEEPGDLRWKRSKQSAPSGVALLRDAPAHGDRRSRRAFRNRE